MNISFETQPGSAGKPNEDWVAATPSKVIVLDGVTAPRVPEPGCHHSVPWFTHHLGGQLLTLLDEDNDMTKALARAIENVADLHRHACYLDSPGVPAAAVAMLRRRGGFLEYLVLADTTIVIETNQTSIIVSDNRVDNAAPQERALVSVQKIGTPEHRAATAVMSVAQLQQRNVPGGYWVASSDIQAADNALVGRVPADTVRRVAVFSDGASRIVDTFSQLDWKECLDYLEEYGPLGLIDRVRRIEDGDPAGIRWPRFKKSDDATAAMIQM